MALWGFTPDYGAALRGEAPWDLKKIAKAASAKSEKRGGYGPGERGLLALVADVRRMARCAMLYYGPGEGSSSGDGGAAAAPPPAAAPAAFPHPSTLAPGFSRVRKTTDANWRGGDALYCAAWELDSVVCPQLETLGRGALAHFERVELRRNFQAVLAQHPSAQWYTRWDRLSEAFAREEARQAREAGYADLIA
jgi:hypothetical protein